MEKNFINAKNAHFYTFKNGLVSLVISWTLQNFQGLHSSTTEQTALALHTVAQDDTLGGSAVQVNL